MVFLSSSDCLLVSLALAYSKMLFSFPQNPPPDFPPRCLGSCHLSASLHFPINPTTTAAPPDNAKQSGLSHFI